MREDKERCQRDQPWFFIGCRSTGFCKSRVVEICVGVLIYWLPVAGCNYKKHSLPFSPTGKSGPGLEQEDSHLWRGELGTALFRAIANSPRLGILPIGFIDDNPDKADTIHRSSGFSSTAYALPVLGTGDDIGALIKQYRSTRSAWPFQTSGMKPAPGSWNGSKRKTLRLLLFPTCTRCLFIG